MNWFNFGSASNTEHVLKIDFCSCGEGEGAKVTEMKSDNKSSVMLDNQLIVERTAHSQSTMATWGPNVAGSSSTLPYTGNGVDHSLIFKVKNVGGPSGGAIDGTLKFTGHLGACTKEDVLPK